MPAELMVINPVRRRKRRSMSAKQKRYFGKRRRTTRVRRNPVAVAAPYSAPRRRRRSSRRTVARARSYYRRARSSNFGQFLSSTLIPASVGAAGALALDMAWGRLPIPDNLKSGPLAPLVRIAGAVAIGYGVSAIAGKKFGDEAMAGAVTVTLYDLMKSYMAPSVPATPASVSAFVDGLGYNTAARGAGLGMFVNDYA